MGMMSKPEKRRKKSDNRVENDKGESSRDLTVKSSFATKKPKHILLVRVTSKEAQNSLFGSDFQKTPLIDFWVPIDRLTGGLLSRSRSRGIFYQKDSSRLTILSGAHRFDRIYLWASNEVFPFKIIRETEGDEVLNKVEIGYWPTGFSEAEVKKCSEVLGKTPIAQNIGHPTVYGFEEGANSQQLDGAV